MKQETIDQIMRIAGFTESTGCIALRADQVKAMLESAYEAGQRTHPLFDVMPVPVIHNEDAAHDENAALFPESVYKAEGV